MLIFDLKDSTNNFTLTNRIPEVIYHCNAELRSTDSLYFISATDSSLFEFGKSQSSDFAHSGRYASKLSSDAPYGMTIKLSNLKNGESIVISIWRKTNNSSKGGLIASSSTIQYYNNRFKVVEKGSSGWEKIMMEVFVSSKLENKELTIYAYNPDTEPIYFDDFEIIRYKSIFD